MDRYLEQTLKNWATQQQPPENARARLLLLAASAPQQHAEIADITYEEKFLNSHDIYGLRHHEPTNILDLVWSFGITMPGPRMA
jgi:hypothetical protein